MLIVAYLFVINMCITLLCASSDSSAIGNSSNVKGTTLNIGICNFRLGRNCGQSNVTFYLYTNNQVEGEQIVVNKSSSNLLQTAFNVSLETKILIHGYNSDMFLGVLNGIKTEYFKSGKLNVILIDWSDYAKGPCYPAAVWNCRMVGNCLSQLIDAIRCISTSNVHLLGFSLGSHVAAFASNYASKKVKRITGLDPALPGFATAANENKLDSSDADFVDVIHTNAFMQGTPLQSGHIDFFVNGGIIQPGCMQEGNVLACSHHRAPIYYAESINSVPGFWGWSCSSFWEYLIGRCWKSGNQTIMGEHTDRNMRGIFLVITNSQAEYAMGPYSNTIRNFIKMNNDKLQQIAQILLKDSTAVWLI
ncbi:hypothetical protein PPYR_11737 [Photinus pyralis]|uniref:Lipase domain-containing protein n=1 Tax=Photinus pyralis TaxID=7054 RepID=A0A5N4ACC2_PHOPY|nr:hypothetical protein PPYR_11737 [Photinus pyralis]